MCVCVCLCSRNVVFMKSRSTHILLLCSTRYYGKVSNSTIINGLGCNKGINENRHLWTRSTLHQQQHTQIASYTINSINNKFTRIGSREHIVEHFCSSVRLHLLNWWMVSARVYHYCVHLAKFMVHGAERVLPTTHEMPIPIYSIDTVLPVHVQHITMWVQCIMCMCVCVIRSSRHILLSRRPFLRAKFSLFSLLPHTYPTHLLIIELFVAINQLVFGSAYE